MSDSYRKPVSGEPFVPSVRMFGAMIDTITKVDELTRAREGEAEQQLANTRINIKNATGGALTGLRPVVAIGSPILSPESNEARGRALQFPTFEGVQPAAAGDHFAVLQGPLAAGVIAPAVVSGGTWVRIRVVDAEHRFADVDGSTERLTSAGSGPAAIIALAPEEEGEEDRWAFVRLSNPLAESDGQVLLYPPGIRCNDSNCPEGENIGSDVCCETHRVWRAYIPPFQEVLFEHVSGNVWETDEFQYGDCPQVYIFRRTLYLDASGRRQSRICLIKVSDDGTTTTSTTTTGSSTTSASTTADDCEEIQLTYESPWFVNCPCEQPHKLSHWAGHPCCAQISPLLSQWICLKPVVALAAPGSCEPGAPGLTLPGQFLIDLGSGWQFGPEADPDFRDCEWLRGNHIVDASVNATQPCQWKKAVDGVTRLVFWLAVNPGGVPHDELWVTAYPPFNAWRWSLEIPHQSFDPEATYTLTLEFEPSTEYCAGAPLTISVSPYSGQPAQSGGACSDPCDAPTTDTSTTDSSTTGTSSTTDSTTTASSTYGGTTTSSTTSGTTTVPDGIICDCKWVWNGSSWNLDNSSCVDCAMAPVFSHCCTPPGSPGGFVGDVEFTFCSTCP